MKKIFLVLFALVLTLSFGQVYAADIPSPGIGDVLGQGKLDSAPHRIFRFVRVMPYGATADTKTLTADSIVIWDKTSADGVTVTQTVTSNDICVAGILKTAALTPEVIGRTATEDIGKRNWGWLQTYGITSAEAAVGQSGQITARGLAIGTSKHPGMIGAFSIDATQLSTYNGSTSLGIAGFSLAIPSAADGAPMGIFLKGLD